MTSPAWAASSVNVAIVGSGGVINGGFLPTSGADMPGVVFAPLLPADVTAANLVPFDTVVLNVASSQLACNVLTNLSAGSKTDLVAWVAAGHKLIIYDSECAAQDYSWLPFPFTTSNPGALGATGTAVIVEENTLSSNDPTSPYFINTSLINTQTDAVGDANVMATFNPNWCLDITATNGTGFSGPTHTYAKTGADVGLIIYNGLDVDYMTSTPGTATGAQFLRELYVQEILQPFNPSNLPCGVTVVGITLTPATATNNVGTTHTVTAKLTDLLGAAKPGILVTFTITSGPNAGASGVCNPATCMTDVNGQVTFTYTGSGGAGTDKIQASFLNGTTVVVSQTVDKIWVQAANKCPLSQGYWVNHQSAWPASALPMTFGGQTYTQAELVTIMKTPVRGDARLILAQQVIAAKLNIANGSDPVPVASVLATADTLLTGKGHLPSGASISPSTADGQAMVAAASTLDQYNNGLLTLGCTP